MSVEESEDASIAGAGPSVTFDFTGLTPFLGPDEKIEHAARTAALYKAKNFATKAGGCCQCYDGIREGERFAWYGGKQRMCWSCVLEDMRAALYS